MSEQRHTPGPWKWMQAKDARGNHCAYAVWPDLDRPYTDSPRGHQICRTPDGTTPEAAANAQLIAAVPELLDACKLLLGSLEYLHGESSPDPFGRIGLEKLDKARAAIAKAEARPE